MAIVVAQQIAKTDRQRDDLKRQEDRDHEADLRRRDAEEWDRRTNAERRDREDFEARQVTVETREVARPNVPAGSTYNRLITVRSPAVFPIRRLEVQIAGRAGGTGVSLLPIAHEQGAPVVEDGFTVCRYWAEFPQLMTDASPIVRFIDRHGNLYYQYRGHTHRFPQGISFLAAAMTIQGWLDAGPKQYVLPVDVAR